MKLAVFSTKQYDKKFLEEAILRNKDARESVKAEYFTASLDSNTAKLTKGFDSVCIFVNDQCGPEIVEVLSENGVKLILLRCAGEFIFKFFF